MPLFNKQGHLISILILFILLFVTGCQNATPQATVTPAITTESPSPDSVTKAILTSNPDTEEPAETHGDNDTQEETESPTERQPTPAPTLSDWRDAPIMPIEISNRVLEIYKDGQAQGRDPASFSVIGDCQSIPFVFMGPFSRGELEPDASESQLWNAINYFDASFKRWAVTARGGFTAASIINALQADPNECKPGETPLTCEFRLNNPAFVLITLETWLDPESIDRYEVYLRQILDTVIEKGSVPILLTKADSSELKGAKHVINPAIVNLAYEYQVPVVNFWRAAQYLDNYGIDPDREGFHLSQAGYNLKNILALRTLYEVWTAVEGKEIAAETTVETPAATETPEPTEVLSPEITNPDCEGGCVFFGSAQSHDGAVIAQGVYAYEIGTKTVTQVLGSGFDLQDVSTDGTRLLVNNNTILYEIDLEKGEATIISKSFFSYGQQGAYWDNEDSGVIYLDQDAPIQTETGEAYNLFPAPYAEGLYFNSGECTSKDFCQSNGVFYADPEGDVSQLDTFKQPVFSPDGGRVAFLNPDAATRDNYYHIHYLIMEETETGISSRRVLYFPEEAGFEVYPDVEEYAFSPDNDKLFILYNVYSEYYEKSLRLQTYLWNLQTGILYNFGKLDGVNGSLNPRFAWSPDSDSLLFFLTDLTEEGEYIISVYKTDLESGERLVLVHEGILSDTDYLYLTNLYWR